MTERRDDFYVGYRPQAPPRLASWLRRLIAALLSAAALLAAVLVLSQGRFADSRFEYGNVRSFDGRLSIAPYPSLTVDRPPDVAGVEHLLVDVGKHGADARVSGLDRRRVRLEGQRIHRDGSAMIELATSEIVDVEPAGEPMPAEQSLGEHRLAGEIVDSKCHFGVMKPGEGKPHRACAARCISGGVPPALWVRDAAGSGRHYLLVGRDGRALHAEVLPWVAEPVEVRGEVVARGDLWLLRTEPEQIRRVNADGD